jgi:hypothetical protein
MSKSSNECASDESGVRAAAVDSACECPHAAVEPVTKRGEERRGRRASPGSVAAAGGARLANATDRAGGAHAPSETAAHIASLGEAFTARGLPSDTEDVVRKLEETGEGGRIRIDVATRHQPCTRAGAHICMFLHV